MGGPENISRLLKYSYKDMQKQCIFGGFLDS